MPSLEDLILKRMNRPKDLGRLVIQSLPNGGWSVTGTHWRSQSPETIERTDVVEALLKLLERPTPKYETMEKMRRQFALDGLFYDRFERLELALDQLRTALEKWHGGDRS